MLYLWPRDALLGVGLRQAVQRFAVLDLSNFYLDVAKDRLYVRGATSQDRRCVRRQPTADTVSHSALGAGHLPSGTRPSASHLRQAEPER
jgi:hypothetical protein